MDGDMSKQLKVIKVSRKDQNIWKEEQVITLFTCFHEENIVEMGKVVEIEEVTDNKRGFVMEVEELLSSTLSFAGDVL